MKVLVEIVLDQTWDEYNEVDKELFIEDLFPINERKDGISKISIIEIENI